jgi:ubiquitin fusion degradation protein 1
MLFKVTNEGVERSSHCGVLEFSAPEGTCYLPYWVRRLLALVAAGFQEQKLTCCVGIDLGR